MKLYIFFPFVIASGVVLSSCASSLSEEYDVSNPYAAPDYPGDNTSPYAASAAATTANVNTNVNPAYNAPAAYENTAAYKAPATNYQPVSSGQGKEHTVVRGDTLWGLSRKYGVSVDSIKSANGLTSDVAVLGARLQIPAS